MRKPESLRAFLAAAVPQIAAEPALLQVFVDGGRVVPRAPAEGPSPGVSGYEYRYRLQLALLDFAGAPDQVMVPLLNWLAVHQSELVLNPERAKEAIAFRVEILDPGKVDLEIELQLTESFGVRPRPGGGGSGGPGAPGAYDIAAWTEPAPEPCACAADPETVRFYLAGELIAEFTPAG